MIFRRKVRYLMVEASGHVAMNDPQKVDALKRELFSFLGELPYFKANPQVAAQLNDNVFVISVNRGYERNTALALAFAKRLDGRKIGFYTIKTSGTIRSIKEAFWKLY